MPHFLEVGVFLIHWLVAGIRPQAKCQYHLVWSGLVWCVWACVLFWFCFLSGAGWVAGWWHAWRCATANLCQQAGPDDSLAGVWTGREPQFAHDQGSHVAGPGLLRDVCRRSAGKRKHRAGNDSTHAQSGGFCSTLSNTTSAAWILFLNLIQSSNRLHLYLLFIHFPRLEVLC